MEESREKKEILQEFTEVSMNVQDHVLAGLFRKERKHVERKKAEHKGPSRRKHACWYLLKTHEKENELCQKCFF